VATGAGQRVLLVEDHLESATSLERLLHLFGYEVHVETNGLAAVEAAPRFAPFAALIDLTLPLLDGFAVAERLRVLPETRDALLIAMTGWATEEHARRARAAGFDKHLVKPLSVDVLVDALAVHA
jgi:two-component system CheB/CheR fusion protein